jgi:hypothetical protein
MMRNNMSILLCSTVKRGKAIKYIETLVNSRSTTVGEMGLLEEKVKRKMGDGLKVLCQFGGRVAKIDTHLSNVIVYEKINGHFT